MNVQYHGGASINRGFSDVHAGVLSAPVPPFLANPTFSIEHWRLLYLLIKLLDVCY